MLRLLPLAAIFIATAAAQPVPVTSRTPAPSEIVAAAPAADWLAIAPADLLVMDLAPDNAGKPRRVVIQLMPAPLSQGWIGNIRKLAAAHWWDGLSVNRVQDNYVVQWGDADGEDKAKAKPLRGSLAQVPQDQYQSVLSPQQIVAGTAVRNGTDSYAPATLFHQGWPLAGSRVFWPVHCYGMVGVGRDMPPDTGSGAELYTVIGHAPRHLDRNIALIGRVIEGIEHLSSLPRGTGALGFYETAQERVPIVTIRMGDEVPALPAYQYLSTQSDSFAAYAAARANRRDPFFVTPAGGADICNIPVPVRRATPGK